VAASDFEIETPPPPAFGGYIPFCIRGPAKKRRPPAVSVDLVGTGTTWLLD